MDRPQFELHRSSTRRRCEVDFVECRNSKCKPNTVAKVHTTRLFQSFKEWAKENNEYEQIRSSRAMIGLLRDRGYEVSVGSQNKHYVHGLGLEAEENETWVN